VKEVDSMPLTDEERDQLCQRAAEVAQYAYAPYSNYSVGSAVLFESAEIFVGSNVENCSFGLTICAERTAIGQGVSCGLRRLRAVAVSTVNGGTPCGACRQVISEFATEDCVILICKHDRTLLRELPFTTLLPESFRDLPDE